MDRIWLYLDGASPPIDAQIDYIWTTQEQDEADPERAPAQRIGVNVTWVVPGGFMSKSMIPLYAVGEEAPAGISYCMYKDQS